ADVADLLSFPEPSDHKYTRGVLGLVAGSTTYPGAAVLASAGPLHTGLGMVRYLGPDAISRLVHQRFPEVVLGTGRVQAWAVGSGVDPADGERAEEVRDAVSRALADGLPAVLDAGSLAPAPPPPAPTLVLPPHPREPAAPLPTARRAAVLTGAVVLLKGATTVVAAPGGTTFAQADGTPWLATAGTGDVLTGVLGALLAVAGEELTADRDAGGARTAALAA